MRLDRLLLCLGLLASLSAPALSQCLTPDGLDLPGAICAPVQAAVKPKSFTQPSLGICWQDCGVVGTGNYTAVWDTVVPYLSGTPALTSCAWFRARLRLFNASNQLAWVGSMQLSYARTWIENPPGQQYQVWRYLVNGDMRAQGASALPCANPPCASAFGGAVRFTGYVDYTNLCGTILNFQAWMLTHACDAIDHAPGFPRAGSFHPNRYYAFAGPAAGFVVAAGTTVEAGSSGIETLRRWDASVLPARCNSEEQLTAPASITPNTFLCQCGTGPTNWFEGTLSPVFGFASTITPFPGSDPFRSFPVGQWTNPNVYPGVEELRWNCNEAQWVDCTGVGRQEFYFGVTTAGGYPAMSVSSQPSFPLPLTFIDQSNSVLLPAGVATRNRPYLSDHVLNLNF